MRKVLSNDIPVFQKPRRLPINEREDVKKQIDEFVRNTANSNKHSNEPLPTTNSPSLKAPSGIDCALWERIDERLKSLCESISKTINNQISESETRILAKIEKTENHITEIQSNLNAMYERVNKVESSLTAAIAEIETLKTDLKLINSSLSDTKTTMSTSEAELSNAISNIDKLQLIAEAQENRLVAADAILYGVPHQPEEKDPIMLLNFYFSFGLFFSSKSFPKSFLMSCSYFRISLKHRRLGVG